MQNDGRRLRGNLAPSTFWPLKLDPRDSNLFSGANLLTRNERTTRVAAKSGRLNNLRGRLCPVWVFIWDRRTDSKPARYDQSVAGGIISGPQFKEQFNNPSQTMIGFITSSYHLGCTLGAFATIFIGNHGRKKCIVLLNSYNSTNFR